MWASTHTFYVVNNYENEKKEIFKGALRGCI